MILHIDTKDRKQIKVSLKKDGKVVKSLSKQNEYGSQVLLPLIDRILKTKDLKPEDLEEIEVETGPGSFTGLRVGVSVANALGFALGIPVNGKKIETNLLY
ncbi:tRNA (adenosine(37)-N6)-threonylcarbamoyltransferase complex dimerization subunit type 1 TsaB [Candidatus Daviesbacteria bacterium RIFCSPLOWO2_01_FULL_39_12]|uniref:tRNA (Adenosine(37)-N6)-threonylcarbamoyltransferase complex dimerization subunit type 1 TsaB n=1 Tax=Candidatus Daviesbacteria bacterium RIFCSPLOWO2_01_FULL_39_12 TaxID=1797785 RepID=A0A1F5KS19_9BACT|nr:MAG: tRNA (adenosine(37)-N6)-threonylcarbamoyltransferase complex dimerization subunit type 1 TsaB [Candidatus Daviesbacteria bacterium RIFCSPHIGHO2_02_FULL_39_8]OGE43716.1 MAG: tRNA (adenosine(37)-N6)-threonylcarbamoyltransferase complex dimerization subunit type 1 TsaB [Candidatus Daviesbacteria bacterium RIFCSPLOWO2_01_FULL_39_12]